MKLRLLCLAAAVLAVMLPGLARAAPPAISPAEYAARLQRAHMHLIAAPPLVAQARQELGGTWEVQTNPPTVADLRPVQDLINRGKYAAAAEVVAQHRQAFDALQTAGTRSLPGARERLDKALQEAEKQRQTGRTAMNWFVRLWERLFGGAQDEPRSAAADDGADARGVSPATYVALIIGVVGVSLLGWYLSRTLSGNAAGTDATLRSGRGKARPDRPATPDELWQLAGEQAAAGDYKEGLRLAHLALLQHLDRSGLLRYIPAQTNREHEWMLRRKQPELARTMHQLNDLVESRLYSGHGATADDFRRGESLAQQLWREGDAVSKSAQETTGA
ncbi:MAG TPA: DUF4129 domain-containing protein [Symbiobacteriaceae bacterium]|nr:DUF4129 domain-containing protein [Symbiobacteriaceae bacterium]